MIMHSKFVAVSVLIFKDNVSIIIFRKLDLGILKSIGLPGSSRWSINNTFAIDKISPKIKSEFDVSEFK